MPPGCIGVGRGVLRDLRANSLFTMLRTWLHGELVGVDDYGNRYYRERGYRDRRAPGWRTERRWVVFSRDADPTRVPTGWVGWLHGRLDQPPSEQPLPAPSWAKERLPNLTGTPAAYLPPGAIERGGQRAPATGDYEAWRPE
jgi:NADH:ubiquinone oxidoreductase subunit